MPDRAQYYRWLQQDAAAFGGVIQTGDPERSVPACPGWTLRELTIHLGGVHRWARDAIITGKPQELERPAPGAELPAWFALGAESLLDVLRRSDPAAPAWTFGPHPRTVGFWDRRQAQETAIHLWDAHDSQGTVHQLDPELALDGIAEIVEVMFPRQVRRERIAPLGVGLRVRTTESPGREFVIAGTGVDGDRSYGATISGPAADVLLTLWGRVPVDHLDIEGDRAVADQVLAAGITG